MGPGLLFIVAFISSAFKMVVRVLSQSILSLILLKAYSSFMSSDRLGLLWLASA